MNLTRAKFDELTHDLVEKTAEPVQNVHFLMQESQHQTWSGTVSWWIYTYPGSTGRSKTSDRKRAKQIS